MYNSTTPEKKKEGFLGQQMIVLPPDSLKKLKTNLLIRDFYLTAIGFYPHAEYHDRKREFGSSEHILLYCTEGEGDVHLDGRDLKLKPNHYIIIPPHVAHHYKSSIKNPWSIFWVHFSGKNASILYERCYDKKEATVNFIPYDELKLKIFIAIIQLLEFGFEKSSLELANINLKYFLSSFIYEPKPLAQISGRSTVQNSIEFMKENLKDSFKIEDFAARENLSVSRFSEVFRKETGYPPIHYFIKMKIHKSCQFLYFTDMNIKEICLKVGFTDQYYFSRIFKKIMGVPPSKYKENYKK